MNNARLKTGFLLVLAGAVPIAYFAGGVSGFGKGFGAAQFSESANTTQTVFLLRKLRAGETGSAIRILESQLDGLIIQNSTGREPYLSAFNLPRLFISGSTANVDKLASRAIRYRAEYPSIAPEPVNQLVDGALARLAEHATSDD